MNGFQSNIYLPRSAVYFIHENEGRHSCDLCGPDVTATSHCTICEENYCERCSEVHLKQRATRTHTLISLSTCTSGPRLAIKKRQFCTKHPNDELRVVCKDCNDELLCIICKVTEHEKHTSREIADEAKTVKETTASNFKQNDKAILELHKVLDNLKYADDEASKRKDSYLEGLGRFEKNLQLLIRKRTKSIREKVCHDFEHICGKTQNSISDTEAMIKSLENVTLQINQLLDVTDDVFVMRNMSNIRTVASKNIEQARTFISKGETLGKTPDYQFGIGTEFENVSPRSWNQLVDSYMSLNCKKSVSEVSQILLCSNTFNLVGSVSTNRNRCACSCTYSQAVVVTYATENNFNVLFPPEKDELICCISILPDKCFYSILNTKELKVWDDKVSTPEVLGRFQMHPHGIARRLYECEYEEILVCLLEDSDIFSTIVCNGIVKVIPTTPGRQPYDFITEAKPAPTRAAVNKQNGLVCLSYPSVGKISVHFEDGTVMHSFEGKHILPAVDGGKFTPFGICFDNDNCIVIANRDGAKVLRVSVFGELIQVLLEGNKPNAVAVDVDDKLWVGYDDKNVTMYQVTNE